MTSPSAQNTVTPTITIRLHHGIDGHDDGGSRGERVAAPLERPRPLAGTGRTSADIRRGNTGVHCRHRVGIPADSPRPCAYECTGSPTELCPGCRLPTDGAAVRGPDRLSRIRVSLPPSPAGPGT